MKLLLVQGTNMQALGHRQPDLYGRTTARQLDALLRHHARQLGAELDILYTNHEGAAVTAIHEADRGGVDGILVNPAGFLHAARALADCLRSAKAPVIEVHMTNIEKRGRRSVTADAAIGVIAGFGIDSYILALDAIVAQREEARA
jgi:3-dehydroquinate dehydratase-2